MIRLLKDAQMICHNFYYKSNYSFHYDHSVRLSRDFVNKITSCLLV